MSLTIKRNGQVIKTVERENKLRNTNGKEGQHARHENRRLQNHK